MATNGYGFFGTPSSPIGWENTNGPVQASSLTPQDSQFLQKWLAQGTGGVNGAVQSLLSGNNADIGKALTQGNSIAGYNPSSYNGPLRQYYNQWAAQQQKPDIQMGGFNLRFNPQTMNYQLAPGQQMGQSVRRVVNNAPMPGNPMGGPPTPTGDNFDNTKMAMRVNDGSPQQPINPGTTGGPTNSVAPAGYTGPPVPPIPAGAPQGSQWNPIMQVPPPPMTPGMGQPPLNPGQPPTNSGGPSVLPPGVPPGTPSVPGNPGGGPAIPTYGSTLGTGPKFPAAVPIGADPGNLADAYQAYLHGANSGNILPLFHYQAGSPHLASFNASAMLQAQRAANGNGGPYVPYGGTAQNPQPVSPQNGSLATNPNLNTTLRQSGLYGN